MSDLATLHHVALRVHSFCTANPAIGREVGVHALFMSLVGEATSRVRIAEAKVKSAEAKARISAIRAGQLPSYRDRQEVIRSRRKPVFHRAPHMPKGKL